MAKNHSKKSRLSSLNARRIVEKVYDVTLSEFADSDLPAGKGRLKKASSVISHGYYWEKNFTAVESNREIIKYEGEGVHDQRTVQRWLEKFSSGDTALERKKGSRRLLMDIDEVLKETVESNPSTSTRKLARECVRQISTSEDIDIVPTDDSELNSVTVNTLSVNADGIQQNDTQNDNEYTEYPVKIWLLLAEYIRPEDVKSFSLICRNTLSVVNTASFWIRLYKRCYTKVDLPKCLTRQCLDIKRGLKQKVVRSLFYCYPPYALSVINNNVESNESLIGAVCLHHGIQSSEERDSNDGLRWLYSFKLCDKDNESISYKLSYGINHNPEAKCRLLKFICKEFIVIPNVRGMRLRKMDVSAKSTMLKFSSAPLSRVNSELGTVIIHLDHTQKPVVIPWWHPDYWDHMRCCNRKYYKLPVSC